MPSAKYNVGTHAQGEMFFLFVIKKDVKLLIYKVNNAFNA